MITVQFDDKMFLKEMNNVLDYAAGFVDGAKRGRTTMLKNISYRIKEALYAYIDTTARMEPERLHHVYEWYQIGSPAARLYDIDCIVSEAGITFSYTLSQSKSIRRGSNVPFYNKASIMENGIPVTIVPRKAQALVFEDNGETIFTKKPVHITDPGGEFVQGGFSETLKTFFNQYVSQVFLDVTGIRYQLQDTSDFAASLPSGKAGGYSVGVGVGERWISKVGARL